MTDDKREPPLHIEMDADEALERFIGTKPKEVADGIKRAKKKNAGAGKPPPARPAKPLSPASRVKKGKRR